MSNKLNYEIITKKENFYKVKTEIEKKIKEFVSSGIEWMPVNKIALDKDKTRSVLDFLETFLRLDLDLDLLLLDLRLLFLLILLAIIIHFNNRLIRCHAALLAEAERKSPTAIW